MRGTAPILTTNSTTRTTRRRGALRRRRRSRVTRMNNNNTVAFTIMILHFNKLHGNSSSSSSGMMCSAYATNNVRMNISMMNNRSSHRSLSASSISSSFTSIAYKRQRLYKPPASSEPLSPPQWQLHPSISISKTNIHTNAKRHAQTPSSTTRPGLYLSLKSKRNGDDHHEYGDSNSSTNSGNGNDVLGGFGYQGQRSINPIGNQPQRNAQNRNNTKNIQLRKTQSASRNDDPSQSPPLTASTITPESILSVSSITSQPASANSSRSRSRSKITTAATTISKIILIITTASLAYVKTCTLIGLPSITGSGINTGMHIHKNAMTQAKSNPLGRFQAAATAISILKTKGALSSSSWSSISSVISPYGIAVSLLAALFANIFWDKLASSLRIQPSKHDEIQPENHAKSPSTCTKNKKEKDENDTSQRPSVWDDEDRIQKALTKSKRSNAWVDQSITNIQETNRRIAHEKAAEQALLEKRKQEKARQWVEATMKSSELALEKGREMRRKEEEEKLKARKWAESMVRSTGIDL